MKIDPLPNAMADSNPRSAVSEMDAMTTLTLCNFSTDLAPVTCYVSQDWALLDFYSAV
jgi:hypothetical protein